MPGDQAIKQNNLEKLSTEIKPGYGVLPEMPPAPEMPSPETGVETAGARNNQETQPATYEVPPLATVPAMPLDRQQMYRAVEDILADGLAESYNTMPPDLQYRFKIKGEETTGLIVKLLAKPKVKVRKIINLIIEWLKLIPGVNRFFLEQTAKIKTDQVLDMVSDDEQKIIR